MPLSRENKCFQTNTFGVLVESPIRIDLFGTWSDHLDFLNVRPSRVINCGIKFSNQRMPVKVRVKFISKPIIIYRSIDRDFEREMTLEDIKQSPVTATLLTRYPATNQRNLEELLKKHGGILLETESNVPFRSGLGTSSTLTVCCVEALLTLNGQQLKPKVVAETAYRIERQRNGAGWQDHYAAAFGGPLIITRSAGDTYARVQRLSARLASVIENHSLLVFLSREPHSNPNWTMSSSSIRTVENMDKIVEEFLTIEPAITPYALMSLLPKHWQLAMKFYPEHMVLNLNSLIKRLAPLDVVGSLVGAGPTAFIVTNGSLIELRTRLQEVFVGNFTNVRVA